MYRIKNSDLWIQNSKFIIQITSQFDLWQVQNIESGIRHIVTIQTIESRIWEFEIHLSELRSPKSENVSVLSGIYVNKNLLYLDSKILSIESRIRNLESKIWI